MALPATSTPVQMAPIPAAPMAPAGMPVQAMPGGLPPLPPSAVDAGIPANLPPLPPGTVLPPDAPGTAVVGAPMAAPATAMADAGPAIPLDVQVVRFHGPEGVSVEVISPAPEAVPVGDGHGLLTVGLRVGTPYRLRVTNLPEKPGVEIFPV